MKRRLLLFVLSLLSVFMLVGCFNNEKEFSGIGMTITLNKNFVETEVIQFPLYLESKDIAFMGVRQTKSELSYMGVDSMNSYIRLLLNENGKDSDIKKYEKDELLYYYAYYTSEVEDQTFGYMLVVMETDTHFYSMNFASLEKNLDKNKSQFKKWIETIEFD